jgi:predicted ATPase
VGGLPAILVAENLEDFSSIKLFLHHAQRLSPKFDLKNNIASIIRICQLVNGLPLGIVLASSWVRVYSCSQIAEEINKNIDFLDISSPDIAPRQRSLRAVFDNSWRLLSQDERRIFRQLSVFPAAFTAHAAEEICSASNLMLVTFIDKSLLYRHADRFEMLDTFHHYALGKLEEITEEDEAARIRFANYYADFCEQKNLELNSSIQRQALDEMIPEMENIRGAWNWMVDCDQWNDTKG